MVNADESRRHPPAQSLFLSTHEPCPMCASAIAWGGYDTCYYLFSHEDSRDSFQIGHDLMILAEVFRLPPGAYARQNAYWTAYSLVDLAERCPAPARTACLDRIDGLRARYAALSARYQATKTDNRNIPLK